MREKKTYWGSRRGSSPGDVASQRWKWVGTKFFGRPLSVEHNAEFVSNPRLWSKAGISVWHEKDHKPSVSSESTDAVNLITGNENQWCKSTMRGLGQDNCMALRYWGEILHFVIIFWQHVYSVEAWMLRKLTHEGLLADCSAWKFYCFEKWSLKTLEERSASKREVLRGKKDKHHIFSGIDVLPLNFRVKDQF